MKTNQDMTMCNMENTKSTPNKELGIWTLPATIGAVRLATESSFQPAHYDAVERAVRRIGGDQITRQDVSNIKLAIDTSEAAICKQCGGSICIPLARRSKDQQALIVRPGRAIPKEYPRARPQCIAPS